MSADGTLRVGCARRDITPEVGTQIAGDGTGLPRPAKTVLDPLYARAAVFACGDARIAILSLDVLIVTEEWTARIRDAAEALGFAREAVMVHALQDHSAPTLGHMMFDPDFMPDLPAELEYLRGGETRVYEACVARAIEALQAAAADLRPVTMGFGRAVRDDLAFNRRGVTRNGGIVMPWLFSRRKLPLGPTHIAHLEGPSDPEVGVVAFRDSAGRVALSLLHHTCHPVNVFCSPDAKRAVSADWPGAWVDGMAAVSAEALVLNGCCGNINPIPPFTPDVVLDHRRMGGALAESGRAVIERMEFGGVDRVGWRMKRLPIPLKEADPVRLQHARAMLAAHPLPKWSEAQPGRVDPEWFRAASAMSVEMYRRRSPEMPYEIQALRIGDVAIVGLPGEPFVEGQLAIKLASPARQTLVAHCTSHYVGYVPTREAMARGGHEAGFSYWAKLCPEALDMIVAHTTELLCDLFRD